MWRFLMYRVELKAHHCGRQHFSWDEFLMYRVELKAMYVDSDRDVIMRS